jgi:glycosyltransferase involved in cell wall biosynthesis
VTFSGPVGHDALPELYRQSDIFCLPSIVAADGDTEGFPTVILEACASGLACVATTTGGVDEFLCHEENGLLVQPGSTSQLATALDRLLASPELRRQLASNAVSTAREYAWPIIAERFHKVYIDALERSGTTQ